MCTFEPEKPEASVDRGARELPLSPGHDPSKTSSFFACNKRYVKCIKRENLITPQRGLENSAPPIILIIKKIQGIGYFNSENKIRRGKKRERGSGALADAQPFRPPYLNLPLFFSLVYLILC